MSVVVQFNIQIKFIKEILCLSKPFTLPKKIYQIKLCRRKLFRYTRTHLFGETSLVPKLRLAKNIEPEENFSGLGYNKKSV